MMESEVRARNRDIVEQYMNTYGQARLAKMDIRNEVSDHRCLKI